MTCLLDFGFFSTNNINKNIEKTNQNDSFIWFTVNQNFRSLHHSFTIVTFFLNDTQISKWSQKNKTQKKTDYRYIDIKKRIVRI